MLWNDIRFKSINYGLKTPQKKVKPSTVPGVNALSNYLYAAGGPAQQSRMIKDKRRSLDRALLYSYQGAFIKKYIPQEVEAMDGVREEMPARALINPNKLKQDYDDKILSVGFEHDFHSGDIFEWCQTGTYWLIYLQDLTELAYFRGDIRRCRYEIAWLDEEGNRQSTLVAIRGPVETKINYIQKHKISVDEPNHSLNILMPLKKETVEYFQRYKKFYIQKDDLKICWRVEATDWISTPGILEVVAVEYYANETEDDIEEGLVGALDLSTLDPNIEDSNKVIVGDTFIKPKREYSYTCSAIIPNGKWAVDKKYPIEVVSVTKNARGRSVITLKWTSSYTGQFELFYGDDYKKTIVVESLF